MDPKPASCHLDDCIAIFGNFINGANYRFPDITNP